MKFTRRLGMGALVIALAVTPAAVITPPAHAGGPDDTCSYAPTAAPAPANFRPDQLARIYPSDAPARGTYLGVVDAFEPLRAHHPEIMAQNLELTVRANNDATPAQQAESADIEHEDRAVMLANSLGSALGPAFLSAFQNGRLPKTAALIKGDLARAGLLASSTFIEKEYYANPRPHIVAPDRIRHYDRPGEHAYSTRTASYPSGHTNQGYWKAILLATWLPELSPQIMAYASQIGQARVVFGVHYPLDVMGGRMMGAAAAADRLFDPFFAELIGEAGQELRAVLAAEVGADISTIVRCQTPYLRTTAALSTYRERMTYGFPRIDARDVPIEVPAEAAALLRGSHPQLNDAQRRQVLAATSIPFGYPLSKPGVDGAWQRIDLAAAMAAKVTVDADGSVSVG